MRSSRHYIVGRLCESVGVLPLTSVTDWYFVLWCFLYVLTVVIFKLICPLTECVAVQWEQSLSILAPISSLWGTNAYIGIKRSCRASEQPELIIGSL